MSDNGMRAKQDAIHRAMRGGSPGSADEIQRRLRAKLHAHKPDPGTIADVCAQVASADAAGRAVLRGELVAAGWTNTDLIAVGL